MSRSKSFKLMGVVLVLTAPLVGCAVSKSDEKITTNVRAAIDQHPDLGPPGSIRVQTRNGVVYLSGFVDTSYSVENVADVARGVSGVTNVVSDVAVDR